MPSGARTVDVGCGGGFPVLPLAAARTDVSFVALDSTEKKINFVSNVARENGLENVTAIHDRAEKYLGAEEREAFDVTISRGVANTRILAELCVPGLRVGGLFIAMKGSGGKEEAREAADALKKLGCGRIKVEEKRLSGEEVYERTFIIAEKTQSTPDIYPRRYSVIKKAPL